MTFGEKIKTARLTMNLSQTELAQLKKYQRKIHSEKVQKA